MAWQQLITKDPESIASSPSSGKVLKIANDGSLEWGDDTGGSITALTGNVENRIATFGNTTTELVGESGLTYNGSTLDVTGTISASSSFQIDGNTVITTGENYLKLNQANFSAGVLVYNGGLTVQHQTADAKIEIKPHADYDAKLLFNDGDANKWEIMRDESDGHLHIGRAPATSYPDIVINKDNGFIGLGTDSPGAMLDVYDTGGNASIRLYRSSDRNVVIGADDFTVNQTGGIDYTFKVASNDGMKFKTANTDAMIITKAQKVGIGVDPKAKLDVSGLLIEGGADGWNDVNATTGNDGDWAEILSTGGTGSAPFNNAGSLLLRARAYANNERGSINFYTGKPTAHRMRITHDGKHGIGTDSPVSTLHVEGTSSATSGSGAGESGILLKADGDGVLQGWKDGGVNIGHGTYSTSHKVMIHGATSIVNGDLSIGSDKYVKFGNGTSSIRGTGDNGMLRFYTGSTERMRIANDGKHGIGTDSPESVFHAEGAGHVATIESTNTYSYLQFWNTTSGKDSTDNGLTVGQNALNSLFTNREDGKIYLATNDVTRMTVHHDGLEPRIGIGTESPDELLNIEGASDPTILIKNTTDNHADSGKITFMENGGDYVSVGYDGSANNFHIDTSQVSNAFVIDRATGDCGIGTDSPGKALHIIAGATNDAGLSLSKPNNTVGDDVRIWFSDTGSGGLAQIRGGRASGTDHGYLSLVTRDGESYNTGLHINELGFIGLGIDSPTERLHVKGADNEGIVALFEDGTEKMYMYTGSGIAEFGTQSDTSLSFATNQTSKMTITSDGEVGIGTTPDTGKDLHIAQSADNSGIRISGYDDMSGRTAGIYLDSYGQLNIKNAENRSDGLGNQIIYLDAGNSIWSKQKHLFEAGLDATSTASDLSIGGSYDADIIFKSATNSNIMKIDAGNYRVGFGTNPSYGFHIKQPNQEFVYQPTANYGMKLTWSNGNASGIIDTFGNHDMEFRTNNTKAMVIDTSQNVTFEGNVTTDGTIHANGFDGAFTNIATYLGLAIGDGTAGTSGITLYGANNADHGIAFADTSSGDGRYAGAINYDHTAKIMNLKVENSTKLKLHETGLSVEGTYAGGTTSTTTATGTNSFAHGNNCDATGTNGVAFGQSNLASGFSSFAANQSSTASGAYSAAFGLGCSTNGKDNAMVSGSNAKNFNHGELARGYGTFGYVGDAQTMEYVARISTTDGNPKEMFLNGSSQRMVIPNNTTWLYNIQVVARDLGTGSSGTAGDSAGYQIKGVISNDSNTVTEVVGSVVPTVIKEDDSNWTIATSADDTNKSLKLEAKGVADTNIRWVAFIRIVAVSSGNP